MMFKNHLDTIGRNEPIQRKAKFWQSYVRALKGTDDMRAPEGSSRPRSIFRPLLSDFPTFSSKLDTWPYGQSIYADPTQPYDRIHVPGYRYLPISRETYGYTPRNLYPDRYRPGYYSKAWEDHLRRMANLDSLYPRRYAPDPLTHHLSYPKSRDLWKPKPAAPKEKEVAFNYAGQPIYTKGGITRRPLIDLYKPPVWAGLAVRHPWWHEYPELRPFDSPYAWLHSPFYLRDSYLSPVKRTYLWTHHPIRPFSHHKLWL
ncbi:uncharacterized protein LOC124154042 [Ischnura elegans]|uniref:uncharacterized protein LOC124154042 n=1 Tax=Ischnura elegans TaxID=197161 RepID=UPI001ED8B9F7|nr:uncharacterized protein LOC124154042 [Ischnura elegans]